MCVRCGKQEPGRDEGGAQVPDLRREEQRLWPSRRRPSIVVRNVRPVRWRRPLRRQVPRLRRQGPDARHARHARQEGQGQAPPVVLILRLFQPPDGRSHPVAVRVVRPRPAAVRPSRHWPPALVQVVPARLQRRRAAQVRGQVWRVCDAWRRGHEPRPADALCVCGQGRLAPPRLERAVHGVAECGAPVADGWTHDGCQACQDREKAGAEQ